MVSSSVSPGQDLGAGGGPSPPEYKRPFSVRHSLKFYQEYGEYERLVKSSDDGQSAQAPLLLLSQLLPKAIRICLADTFFGGTRVRELQERDLKEALARHGECWTGEDVDPTVTAVERLLAMGSEPTAVDRIDAIKGRMEDYLENPAVEKAFRDSTGKYRRGPARVMTAALVAGLQPREFKFGVGTALKSKGNWEEDPLAVFEVVRATALEWRVVEHAGGKGRGQAGGQNHDAGRAGGSQQQSNQRKTRRSNRKRQSKGKPGSGSGSMQSPRGSGGDPGMQAARPPANRQRTQGTRNSRVTLTCRGQQKYSMRLPQSCDE